ncbi:lysine N(6)-hydroxylase/L-ornithine N(5)-oxygenase family protein [Spirillospora sp. NPDC029432]|uniref:lysine N(6)-hydroxylase/L-ornithine N(5)-oxygenase family protein n=1 Tax=Spirillospora sp. NPDC029432 TaxID=3154599 RepID=UPI00345735F1
MSQPGDRPYDIVGVGFGPANLALAVALEEHNARAAPADRLTAAFVERQPGFGWHRGMLIEGATMQVSFLKDLVTLRDPASGFTFLSYLKEKGRLVDFINHKTFFPTRVEFHDYLSWAAARVEHFVRYGTEAVSAAPVEDGEGGVTGFAVTVRDASGAERVLRARDLVVGGGLQPSLPEGVEASGRVWHNRDLLTRLAGMEGPPPARWTVIGAGQSAAEVADHLHRTYPDAEVCAIFARYGYSPADDSPFANRIFDPAAVDDFHGAPEEVKERLLDYHRGTNYSVVDLDLIEELYRRSYQEKVLGRERLRILNACRVLDVRETPDGVRTAYEFLPTGERHELDSGVVVCATGYRPYDVLGLLGPAAGLCERDERGRVRVERDYRIRTVPGVRAGVYLQGGTEHTHGITSSLLSNGAVRAGEILGSLLARRADPAAARPEAVAVG